MPEAPFFSTHHVMVEAGTGRVFATAALDGRQMANAGTAYRAPDGTMIVVEALSGRRETVDAREAERRLGLGYRLP